MEIDSSQIIYIEFLSKIKVNSIIIYSLIILILLMLSVICSAAETSLTSLTIPKVRIFFEKKKRTHKIILKLLENYGLSLVTILLINTISNISIGIITVTYLKEWNTTSNSTHFIEIISTIVITLTILIIGEIIPKNIIKNNPKKFTGFCSWIIYFFVIILYPATYPISLIFKKKLKTASEKELLELVNIIEKEGEIEKDEKHLIQLAINFDEKKIEDIKIPIEKINFINEETSFNEIIKIFLKTNNTRFPVKKNKLYEKKIKIIGILNIKTLFKKMLLKQKLWKNNSIINLKKMISLQEAIFIDEKTKLDKTLKIMQTKRNHLLFLINKKKIFSGMITLEDIIEQLVGKIYDENDKIKEKKIQEIGNFRFKVHGDLKKLSLFFKKHLKLNLKILEKTTIKEWFISQQIKNKVIKTEMKKKNYLEHKGWIFIQKNKKTKNKGEFFYYLIEKK